MSVSSATTTNSIVPRSVKGRFRRFKSSILLLAYVVYFGLPWLGWSRNVGPDRAVVFDIGARKFYLFDLIVQPQQIFWLTGFLLIAALLLFFVTGIAGRVFCGYFCFQTLWTDLFFLIERRVQGERPARIRLANQPWGGEKIAKKGLTWALWLAVAFWTGLTFTLYWGGTSAGEMVQAFFAGEAPKAVYVTTLIITASTFLLAGFARENVCTHMCPYSRFQAVMFDRNTKLVTYDTARGEGQRGRAKVARNLKTQDERHAAGAGDCIDCGFCVQVCPTGVDIRDGLQISCIHCGLCIDACDNIMDSRGWDRGLVRFTSETELAGGKVRAFTLKNVGYGIALAIVSGILFWSVANQSELETSIRQVRQPLYVTLSDGRIQNSYEIKLTNDTSEHHIYKLSIAGLHNAELDMGKISAVDLKPLQQLTLYAKVKAGDVRSGTEKVADFSFVVNEAGKDDAPVATIPARFYVP